MQQDPTTIQSRGKENHQAICRRDRCLKLNQWLQQLEVCFSVHEVSGAQRITFVCLKLGHALTWWESDVIARRQSNEP